MIPLDRIRQLGEHTIRIQRVGLFVTVEFDGEVVATSSAGTKKIAVYSTTAPVSDFDGVIFETYWKSLTTGRTVWRYPSDAERVRLITKTNIRTDRGYFEQADTTVNSYVNTALDLRGRVSSYTVFIDFIQQFSQKATTPNAIRSWLGRVALSLVLTFLRFARSAIIRRLIRLIVCSSLSNLDHFGEPSTSRLPPLFQEGAGSSVSSMFRAPAPR